MSGSSAVGRNKGEKMKTSDFYYDLPEELIAQDPLADRSASRLLHLDRETGEIQHTDFKHTDSVSISIVA